MNNIRINGRVVTNGSVDISGDVSIPGIILYYDMIFDLQKEISLVCRQS
jgi:hypothetical protein